MENDAHWFDDTDDQGGLISSASAAGSAPTSGRGAGASIDGCSAGSATLSDSATTANGLSKNGSYVFFTILRHFQY